MKFGLSFLPDAAPATNHPAQYFADALTLSRIADQRGLHTIKMTEHYLHPYGGYCPSPLQFLSAVAAQTQRIRLITGCILPAFHHPLQIAADTAMLDAISNGRLDVGFARAYMPYEFDAFGIDLDESRARYEATITAVKQLWREQNVTVNTPYFKIENATNLPPVTQTPHPPIWGAAVNARQSFAWLGEQGFYLLTSPPLAPIDTLRDKLDVYREAYANSAQQQSPEPEIALSLPLCIRETQAQAEQDAAPLLAHYFRVWADAADAWQHRTSNNYPAYTGLGNVLKNYSLEQMLTNHTALVGTPAKVRADIHHIVDTLGVTQLLFQLDFGAQSLTSAQTTLDLLKLE